jgi:cytochrome P450
MSNPPIDYDPFAEAVRRDPHPYYRRLRDEAPAYYMQKYDAWALSRFQDIWEISGDTEHFCNGKGAASAQLLTKDQPVIPTINTIDPPEHTALRAEIRKNFLPRNVRALEEHARPLCRELLEAALDRGEVDIVREFGSRLSATIACLAIGLPVEDGPYLTTLVQAFFTHDPDTGGMTPEGLATLNELNEYCVEKVRERRRQPRDVQDPLNSIATFEHAGALYSDEAAGSHIGMLVIGGTETFPKVLASAMIRLAEHPDQRAELRADPALIPDAFDEVLRYDMPTQYLGRTVKREVEIHGQKLQPGQAVIFLYPSANRDEREFARPDVFDIRRKPARLLSFGAGAHQCLGRHIARMEGRVSLETLLPALGDYEIDFERALRLRTEFVQGYGSLPLRFGA